ncbi:MAG: M4 family metallopeptidase [Vicinamibacterales bacterium]|jgi:thermolysin|nr:M4 family metallopeptidase [Vicinamibacterales bacterium]
MRFVRRLARPALIVVAALSAAILFPAHPSAQAGSDRRAVAASDARDVRAWDTQITRMLRGGQLRSRGEEADLQLEGRSHERLDQYHNGVKVFGGELVRQADGGQAVSVFGLLYTGIGVDVEPALSPRDAAAIVAGMTGATIGPELAPELVVLPTDAGGYVLAYRLRVLTADDLTVFFIDAATGGVALRYSDLQTTIGTGQGVQNDTKKISTTVRNGAYLAIDLMRPPAIYTYDLKGNLARTQFYLNGLVTLNDSDVAADADNQWTDTAAVDAHAYAGWTYDYLYKRFNRQGLDNRNLTMTSIVHPVKREDWASVPSSVLNLYYLNAFYAGRGIMVYGEGLPPGVTVSGRQWNYFSGALDVVAHELAHGVTDYTSDLIYRNESGALNEAFSDIIGTSVEYFYQQAGAGYLKADYLLGEDLTAPSGAFRSMANPQAYDDPDHYSKRYTGTADNGGVHSNSGIANNAFYLAIEGGANRTSGLPVQGVGAANREKIEKVFYRGFTQFLPANATFSMARAATLQAARDLYGTGSDVERAVEQAWTAVGVI